MAKKSKRLPPPDGWMETFMRWKTWKKACLIVGISIIGLIVYAANTLPEGRVAEIRNGL